MKIIYDTQEQPGKKVYFEDSEGKRHYFPFFKIKVNDGMRQTEFNCWPDAKTQREYFKTHEVNK